MELHKYIEPIDIRIKKLKQEISDGEWDGNDVTHLRKTLKHLQYLSELGEKYNVLF